MTNWHYNKKPSQPIPSTTFPVEFLSASGVVQLKGVYYKFMIERQFEDSITTTSKVRNAETGAMIDASSKEYKEVITAIRETFKGTV